jgi:hypothetical protein
MGIFDGFLNFIDNLFGHDGENDDVVFEIDNAFESVEIAYSSGSLSDLESELEQLESVASELGVDIDNANSDELDTLLEIVMEAKSQSYEFADLQERAQEIGVDVESATPEQIAILAEMGDDDNDLIIEWARENDIPIENEGDYEAAKELYIDSEYELAAMFDNLTEAANYIEGVSEGVLQIVPDETGEVYYVYRTYRTGD